jgi:hypothetical protein
MQKRVGLGLGILLSLGLVACANSPVGDNLSRSLSADPTLTEDSPETTPAEPAAPTPRPQVTLTPTPSPEPATPEEVDLANLSPQAFADLDQVPEELQAYVTDLAELGILTPKSSGETGLLFAPNEPILRREFAQWLVTANNRLYGDRPENRIRLGLLTSDPAFQDVSPTSTEYPYVQGLAEAGLIASRLSGNTSLVNFRPGAPLTRQDVLRWKVPLDIRKPLPTATVEAVEQTWGFQDAPQIDPDALKAILGDYQNGSQANIRRAFGFTTLLQPQKPVTRAEAAAMLWYFGYQGEGISAAEALEQRASDSDLETETSAAEDSPPDTN